jgi:pimeloyl-ACP methyl ester carboxylesterase
MITAVRNSSERSFLVDARLPFLSGLKVAVRVQGTGDPLLLINGMTRPQHSWDHFTRLLTGRTVISFDAPGVGGSPTTVRPLSIAELATLAVAVLDAAEVAEADILGYSHGGAIAQQLAHDAPDRVRSLILAATSCGVGATPGSRADILRSLGRSLDGQPWPLPDPLGLLWQSLAVSNWSSIPFLGSISAPTLVVCGSRDRVVPPANSRVLARRIPDALLVVLPATGHDLQREVSADTLAKVVTRFLVAAKSDPELRSCG